MNVTPLVSREAGTSPTAQRKIIRRPSLSHILIAAAVLLAFIFNFLALQDRSETVLVAVAEIPLNAGERITGSDIRFVPIDADFGGMAGLVRESDWNSMEGWVLTRPVVAGAVIDVGSLNEPVAGTNLRAMSIPIAVEHAAGGLLGVGDVVDVVSVSDGIARFVATGIQVVGLAPQESGGLGGFGAYHVVVSVNSEQALSLAEAIDRGSLEVVRSTGAESFGTNGAGNGSS